MSRRQKKNKTASKNNKKTYIPNTKEQTEEHDLFIDLLSYGRKTSFSNNDIWNYQYV